VARGAVLAVTMRWTDRLIGIVSTLILARLLAPADFGIVAMASLVVALVDTLLDFGVNTALVQKRSVDAEDFHTAWTLRLGQSAAAAAIIALAGAPAAVEYFNDPRVAPVLWIMALSLLASGFENIGLVALQRNMEFGREFRFFFWRRLIGFAVTIALALALRSYWAMVLGALTGRLAGVALSYVMHDFRPRLSTARLRSLWSFSQWLLARNLGAFGATQVDKLIVGRRAGAGALGHYTLADEVAAMPVTELLAPIGRVLLPAFARLVDRPEELRRAFGLALGTQALVALPAGVGLAMVADNAVPVLLGAQWAASIPLLQALALIGVATALTHSSTYLLLALGRVRLQAAFVWAHFAVLAGLLVFGVPGADPQAVAWTRLVVAVLAAAAFLWLATLATPAVQAVDLVRHTWRPLAATALMAGALYALPLPTTWPAAMRLVAAIGTGVLLYAVALYTLWRAAGGPEGAERYVLGKLGWGAPAADGAPTDSVPTTGDGEIACVVAARSDGLPPTAVGLLDASAVRDAEMGRAWFDNLQRTVYPDDAGVRFIAAMRGDPCRAVLPVRLAPRGRVRSLASLSNYYTSLYAPALSADACVDDLAAALATAQRELGPLHEVRLAPMDPGSPSFAWLEAALRRQGFRPFRFFCFGNWHVRANADWGQYLASRPGELRNTVNRMSRKFARAGGSLTVVRDPACADAALAAFLEVYESSWKKPEPHPGFVPGLVRDLAASGSLRLGVAKLENRPVAAQIWSVRGGRAAIVKLAHRTDSTAWSPGTLLSAHMMQQAIDIDGVTEIDYLIGDDPYKRLWMDARRERWGIVAYNPRSVVGAYLLAREAAGRLVNCIARMASAGRRDAPWDRPMTSASSQDRVDGRAGR
jgi:O-antigen/teichoic acid export membrane protein